ncbi:Tetratricopeptide repeat [Phytophthora cactorum]|nr:Tetratricopeptide repeat [Phytophthora cactorum]
MQDSSVVVAAQELRCQQLLREGTTSALGEAVSAAHSCLELDKTLVRGYLLLTEALSRLRRHEDAVIWYKKGLELHPDNAELQAGLKEARVAVLNGLLEESEEDGDDGDDGKESCYIESLSEVQPANESGPRRSTQIVQRAQLYASSGLNEALTNDSKGTAVQDSRETQTTVFQAKIERVLEHLDVLKLARMAAVYIFSELLNLRRVTVGIGLFFLGLLAQAIMHRQKIMVISMLLICLYRSQLKKLALRYAQDWVQTSRDKLGGFTWIPRVVFVVPIFMKVFGHLKFMLFLQQDMRLAGFVLTVTVVLVANAIRTDAGQHAKLWGEGRRLKFAAYFTTIAYWVVWRGQWADTIRLLGPAFIDAGGIVLGSVSSSEMQEVCRRAFKKLYNDVVNDIHADVDLDAWFFLGLATYRFSLEMLSKMLTECLDSMEKAAVRTFSPELRHLRSQLKNMEITDELQLLVAYLKQSLEAVPPPKPFGMVALFAKKCPSVVVFGLLVLFYGVISLPLLSFVVSESHDARELYDRYNTGDLQKKDGLELMLLDSPLFHVWKNVKGCIYCLEGSVTFSKAVATGTQIVSAAARISRLAVFASRVKKEGVFANAHDIPDHIANAFLVTKDSRCGKTLGDFLYGKALTPLLLSCIASLIIDGVRYLRDSTHFQDLQASIANWWSGGQAKEARQEN